MLIYLLPLLVSAIFGVSFRTINVQFARINHDLTLKYNIQVHIFDKTRICFVSSTFFLMILISRCNLFYWTYTGREMNCLSQYICWRVDIYLQFAYIDIDKWGHNISVKLYRGLTFFLYIQCTYQHSARWPIKLRGFKGLHKLYMYRTFDLQK